MDPDGRLVGVLTREDLLRPLSVREPDARVAEAMRRDFVTADESDLLSTALARLRDCRCRTLPVTNRGRLVGLLAMDSLGEYLLVHNALGHQLAPA